MPYGSIPHDSLPKGGTVAYLLAHAEALARAGVFDGRQLAAYIVFSYLCAHPGENLPGHKAEAKAWDEFRPAVDYPHWRADEIAAGTPLHRVTVESALDWLDEQGLIHVDQHGAGGRTWRAEGKKQAKNRKRGEVAILSTCEHNEHERLRLVAGKQGSALARYQPRTADDSLSTI